MQERAKKTNLIEVKRTEAVFLKLEPRNRFQEIDSASLCPGGPVQQPYSSSVPSPLRLFLKRLQIRAQATLDSGIASLETIPGLLKRSQIPWNQFLGAIKV